MKTISTEVLVVGGGAGGIAAAIQASRHASQTILATEFSWLGGMLTSAGVAAPDGNELAPWHTGLWGAYLQELRKRQKLDNGWVSLFTYHPSLGAAIFADWVAQIPNLTWIKNCHPLSVTQHNNKITGVRFNDLFVEAKITIDATELGDLLALADIPYRWGWESESQFNEPSLAQNRQIERDFELSALIEKYPVQAPTWVFLLQYGDRNKTTKPLPNYQGDLSQFQGAWDNYGATKFLKYGKLDRDLYMINWPISGNDYGIKLERLIESESSKKEWLTEAYEHSYHFADYLQSNLEKNYGLANNIFPQQDNSLLPNLDSAFALHPYYRESRRIIGNTTITERDILPVSNGCVAPLPLNEMGEVNSIAVGNYANDHHYPDFNFKLENKSILWGGRCTGTPFTIPYEALVPKSLDGLLVSEKNISVSHIANGSTRLQPVVMNIGQAAGMAAALSIQHNCQPRELAVREVQEALLLDKIAPSVVIPLFNLVPNHPQWLYWQRYYLDRPEAYPIDGNCPCDSIENLTIITGNYYRGIFNRASDLEYTITLTEPANPPNQTYQLITIYPDINQKFLDLRSRQTIEFVGRLNSSGDWLLVEQILN